jgi:hypothetical protein
MRKLRQPKESDIILRVPAWATKVYIMLAAVLLPWTIYIGLTLPHDHLTGHWNASWTGLDIGLIVSLLATGLFAYFRSIWVVIAAASTGSLLIADAWLDIMGEKLGNDFHQALVLAFVFELPLATLSYYLASHTLRHNSGHRGAKKRKH